ncbi:hypothetical protein, partial [Pseudomonas viridiflava]|uniref:hypothetical protein n=1 Tax=Pseudomonas viridiflava TaxID=33069 RepID=UPI0013CEF00E
GPIPAMSGFSHDLDFARMGHHSFEGEANALVDQELTDEIGNDGRKVRVDRYLPIIDFQPFKTKMRGGFDQIFLDEQMVARMK